MKTSVTRRPVLFLLATGLAIGGGIAGAQSPRAEDAMATGTMGEAECGSLRNSVGPWDYRTRDSSERLRGDHDDNMTHHYHPAIDRMRVGEYSQPVIADLDFLVRVWPNHSLGLQALIEYERAGGGVHQFRTVECYFERARRFAPDDVAVVLMEANYFRKKNMTDRARRSYEDALRIQPDSADVNYNAGLFYVGVGEYAKAAELARVAYSMGYPLPGLKSKLAKLGYWREPDDRGDQRPQ